MESVPAEIISFIAGVLGFGGLIGFACGYATKKIVKIIAVILGLCFIMIQIMAYNGLITVNWGALQSVGEEHLSKENLETGMNFLMNVLVVNLPFAGAFAFGFWMGVKKG